MPRRLLFAIALALVAAPSAWAHAIVIGTDPPDGSVLAGSPTVVTVSFDDAVRVGTRNEAIRNEDGADVMRGRPSIKRSRTLVIPLEPNLRDGNYTVRWSIVSDDGHEEEGVIAFGIGEGGGTPTPALGTRGLLTWQQVAMRAVFLLGVLAAAGAAFFGFVVLPSLEAGRELARRHAILLSASFLVAFVGADALIHATTGSSTRFERVLDVAAVTALAGGAAAAAALLYSRAIYLAWAAAAVLVACPSQAGHAVDSDQPRVLAPIADLLHVGAAAVWLGGLASLVFVVGRAPEATRMAAARRFSGFAIPLTLVLATAGVSRALTQLTSVSQLWETAYGRTILVKSALFAVLVVLGWLNRRGLAAGFARLRRFALAELLVLLMVVVAVGTLTDLRPGSARGTAPKATPPRVVVPPPAPPPGAFVDAAQAGPLAVGFAYKGGKAIVTLTGGDGRGVTGTPVTIDGRVAASCGPGCFSRQVPGRSVAVQVGATALKFAVPAKLRPANAEARRLLRTYKALSSVVIDERLSSGPGNFQVTRFRQRAPASMAYRIVAASNRSLVGYEAIVIGRRRWDRIPSSGWSASTQPLRRFPSAYWSRARNAYFVADDELTFYDPSFPGWFRLRFDPRTGNTRELRMVATAHFMHHVYSGFDRPVSISAPPSR